VSNVQIAIADYLYADRIRDLLVRDGTHRVYVVDTANPKIDGVIVMDDYRLEEVPSTPPASERYVVIANKASRRISSLFHAGVHHVVFATDSPSTACLAILAAELRLNQANRLQST
jgi:hypothetical protein